VTVSARGPSLNTHGSILVCSFLAAAIALGCGADRRHDDHAIFLVVVDTLRADRLSSYGYTEHATPGIDSLAEHGVRFENAHATSSWTIPSMAGVMSGRYPSELGLVEREAETGARFEPRERRKQRHFTPSQDVDMLAERLGRAGYRTAAFVNQPGLNTLDGFLQGFDEWFYPIGPKRIARVDSMASLPKPDWSKVLTVAHVSDQKLVEQFEGWLEANGRERVFAWIHLLTPHHPYSARPSSEFGKQRPRTKSGRYDEEIRLVDALVGRIVDAIGREVGRDRSTIVFLSDHGEAFGEHGTDEHGQSLHREVTRVPLIVVDPKIDPGRSFTGHVSLLDVVPTILELAGVDASGELRGQSLVSVLSGAGQERPVYTEGMLYGSSERSLVADGYKLMVDEQAEADLLYGLGSDPAERNDLAPGQPERVRAMRLALETLHAELEASADDASGAAETLSDEEEAEAIRALQALGYVE